MSIDDYIYVWWWCWCWWYHGVDVLVVLVVLMCCGVGVLMTSRACFPLVMAPCGFLCLHLSSHSLYDIFDHDFIDIGHDGDGDDKVRVEIKTLSIQAHLTFY